MFIKHLSFSFFFLSLCSKVYLKLLLKKMNNKGGFSYKNMLKVSIFILVFSSIFITNGFSQKLKLRLDIGNSINYTSYRSKLFQDYYQGPISTSEYTYKKMSTGSLLDIPLSFGASFEYGDKKGNHFTLGFMFNDVISVKDRVVFNFAYEDDMGNYVVAPWSSTSEMEGVIKKLSFEYAKDFGKGIFRVSPLIGLSYSWLNGVTALDTISKGHNAYSEDLLYPTFKFTIDRYSTITGHTSSFMASIGFNLRVHSKKRELFALKFFYQQGLRPLIMNQVVVTRNNKRFIYNVSYSYGSALYLKLSIPIPVYNFDKRRHKKD